MAMTLFPTVRLVVLCVTWVFSLITLAISIHLVSVTTKLLSKHYGFAGLSIASALFSLVAIPILLILDFMQKYAFTSMMAVELACLGFLWILWLSTAAAAAGTNSVVFSHACNYAGHGINSICNEFSAVMAFAFMNWLILMGYTVTLIAFSILGARTPSVGDDKSLPTEGTEYPPSPRDGEKGVPRFTSTLQTQYPPQTTMESVAYDGRSEYPNPYEA